MRTRLLAISTAVLLGLLGTGCGSSAKPAATTVPSTIAQDGPSDGTCPFSGALTSQSEPGGAGSTKLDSATATTSGCIDNVTFAFSPTLASSVTAYETPAPAGGGAVLVITMKNATLGGSLKPRTTVDPKNLNYVSKVELTSSSGDVVWNVTLDKQRPFLVSSSKVPAQLVIAVG